MFFKVRLDLESFTLVDPDVTGNCRTDYMQVPCQSIFSTIIIWDGEIQNNAVVQVTGGVANSRKMPTLCGTNTGQVCFDHIVSCPSYHRKKVTISFNKSRFPQHLIYTAIPNFPARLSIVVDTQVEMEVEREWWFYCGSSQFDLLTILWGWTNLGGWFWIWFWRLKCFVAVKKERYNVVARCQGLLESGG